MTIVCLEDLVGATPLIRLRRIPGESTCSILAKLESTNPSGSVKDRPILNMIRRAEEREEISPGDTLIEATSGNTGITFAMTAALKGYRMILIIPEDMSREKRIMMAAYGAEMVLVSGGKGIEKARDLAKEMEEQGVGRVLDQFSNKDNPGAHYDGTGPEIWSDTSGTVTHFIGSMGTTGTVMGVSRYLKEKNPSIQIIGVQPVEGAQIPGLRRWLGGYVPHIYEPERVDDIIDVSQELAEETTRRMALEEGIFCGISSGGAVAAALRLSRRVENAVIATIICDRGDRYFSTDIYD